jgi:transposase
MLEVGAFPKTGKAYGIKLAFQELFKLSKSQGNLAFYEWIAMALQSQVEPITKVAVSFFNARDKILSWFQSHISNGILEGLHSVLQARKNAARGYRNTDNLITMSYLLHGKLNPTTHTK